MADKAAVHNEEARRIASRIRYAPDVEFGASARRRRDSTDSMSIRSGYSGRQRVEPDVILPVAFRTLSINVEESRARETIKSTRPLQEDKETSEFAGLDWHILTTQQVYERLSTSPVRGLSTEQVAGRLKEYGRNMLTPPPSRWFKKIIKYLFSGFGAILFAAAILVFIAWKPLGSPPALANLALAIVLAVVFVIQACFTFYQDWSSSRVMASIKNMLPEQCNVLRDGSQISLNGQDIVPGDIIYIKMGSKLPADVRFVEVTADAKFDRAILTGETVPLRASIASTDANYLETACIGLAGTHCVSGSCVGIVVSTGDRSVFGKLAKLTNEPKTGLTPLEKEVYYFVGMVAIIMIIMILLVVIVWAAWIRKTYPEWISVSYLIVCCVSVAVAWIPEGLPIAITASLTIVANVMRENQILCKSLKTVETLGAVSVICSDKTGTLTKNKMTVTNCLIDKDVMVHADGGIISVHGDSRAIASSVGIQQIAAAGAICNAAEFDAATISEPIEKRNVLGYATDQAVLRVSERITPVSSTRAAWKNIYRLPFNSKDKFMIQVASFVSGKQTDARGEPTLFIKGAPDVLLPRITRYMALDGTSRPFTAQDRTFIEATKDNWSSEAKRVILLARRAIPPSLINLNPQTKEYEDSIASLAQQDLEIIGIVGIVDPPRDEIPEVIRILHGAGIRVHMVTGDFRLTAQAIAVECGIITVPTAHIDTVSALSACQSAAVSVAGIEEFGKGEYVTNNIQKAIVISGPELMNLSDTQWDQLCSYDQIVFARTTPEQKLRIVKALQARGETVGMTGDGVNDAPSLKAADIGIAMGSGSDIAIEASDMVLLDSFSAIVEAVKYGRVVFDNLKKTICYLLPAGSFSEFWPIITNVLFGLPQVLSSFLMIIICCCTDCAAATAIAYEKPEADVLLRKPRNPRKDRLVDWKLVVYAYGFVGVLQTLASFAMSYWYLNRMGAPFGDLWWGFGKTPGSLDQDTYLKLSYTASSIYFVNLVIMQFFNLLAVRTRRLSIVQHPPLFRKETRNVWLFPAILFAIAIAFFFNYVPKFQEVLQTSAVPVEHWFLPVGFGMGILLLDEARKALVRAYPEGFVAKMAW